MLELLSWYAQVGPWERGLLLFPLGLVVGSFCSMLRHRVPLRQSILLPRSHCPKCQHALGAADLIPVVSYLWLRGRCRYCAEPISWQYLILEVISGLSIALVGAIVGWAPGLIALFIWPVAVIGFAWRSGGDLTSESGLTLVEVLVSIGMLTLLVIPMLDVGATSRGATPFQRQLALSLASAKLEEIGNDVYRTAPANRSSPAVYPEVQTIGNYDFELLWTIGTYSPSPNDFPAEADMLIPVDITVSCLNCTTPMDPVRVVALLGKLP